MAIGRSQIPYVVQDADGNVLEGATVAITVRGTAAVAPLYSSETSSALLGGGASPQVESQENGRIPGWLPEGSYTLVIDHDDLEGAPWSRSLDIAKGAGVGILAADVVTAAKIVDEAITPTKIAAATIVTANILDGAIGEPELADNAASTRTLAPNAIDTAQLQEDSVDSRAINTDAVTTAKIAPGAVGTSELADGSVIAGKWAANSITTRSIVDDEVFTDHLQNDAVEEGKFVANTLQPTDFSNEVLPAGTILPFAFVESDFSVWYPCDGRLYNHNILTDLFAACGWTYGSGVWAGVTYPCVPDLQGRAVFGAGGQNAQGATEGYSTVASRKPKHAHSVGSISLSSAGSSHAHFHTESVDVGKAAGGMSASPGGVWRLFMGQFTAATSSSNHSHSFTGVFGDTAGPLDQPAYQVLKYHIKVI